MIQFIAKILPLLLILTACNNDRTRRLSARNVCKPDTDIAAYSLSKAEVDSEAFAPASLSDTDKFLVANFKTTVTVSDNLENKVTFSVVGSRLSETALSVTIDCAAGLTPDTFSGEPIVFNTPITNADGDFTVIQTTIEFGKPAKEDKSDFLRIHYKKLEVVESENATEGKETTTPQTFSSYYGNASDEITVYKPAKPKEDAPETFLLHHQNTEQSAGLLKISTRLTLIKVK